MLMEKTWIYHPQHITYSYVAQLARATEYTNCISAEGVKLSNLMVRLQ